MYYIFILIIGFLLGYFIASKRHSSTKLGAGNTSFISKQQEEKEENKRKTVELFNTKHQIANDDVENSLGVSDATATRYLDELEKEGKIRQVGKTGRYVSYERV